MDPNLRALAVTESVGSWIDPCEAAENRPDEETLDQPVHYARGNAQRPKTAARRDDRRIGRVAYEPRGDDMPTWSGAALGSAPTRLPGCTQRLDP